MVLLECNNPKQASADKGSTCEAKAGLLSGQVLKLTRRKLTLSVSRVELRLYRRSRTSSDLLSKPPHFIYSLRCDWTTASDGVELPSIVRSKVNSRPSSKSGQALLGRTGGSAPTLGYAAFSPSTSATSFSANDNRSGFENPVAWWDSVPDSYSVRRNWKDIVRFHDSLVSELAYDPVRRVRRIDSLLPALPATGDCDAWLRGYAATGDACALSRKPPNPPDKAKAESLEELSDLHWVYVRGRLAPYFEEVTKVLAELPMELIASSRALRRLVAGRGSGKRQFSEMPVPPRFLGPLVPMCLNEEELAAAAAKLRSHSVPRPRLETTSPSGGSRRSIELPNNRGSRPQSPNIPHSPISPSCQPSRVSMMLGTSA